LKSFNSILGLIDAHNQFKATLGEADAEYKNIIRLISDARQTCQDNGLEITPNPYTNIQPDVSYKKQRLVLLSLIFYVDILLSTRISSRIV
jgi:hypothetical protein